MSDLELRKKIIRLAFENPALRSDLLPLIGVKQAMDKQALVEETQHFIEWALRRNDKQSVADVQRFLEKQGVPMAEASEAGPSKRGQPLVQGEKVEVKSANNTNEKNTDICAEWDKKVGVIHEVHGDRLVVDFDGKRALFYGTQAGQTTGLYRWTDVQDPGGSLIEMVYLKDSNAPLTDAHRIEVVKEYVERGFVKGEDRFTPYYTGIVSKMAMGKNGFYFMMWPQQRGGRPTNVNPAKGDVLYIGAVGHRPGGWKADHKKQFGA